LGNIFVNFNKGGIFSMRYLTVIRNLLLVVAGLALLAGCSISYSSGKSSDSSVSSFSSGGGDTKKVDEEAGNYVDDVAAATKIFVTQGGNDEDFQRRIAFLAGKHGITAWGNDDSTFIAMGKGLKQSGIKEDRISTLPYFSTISKGHNYELLMKGYKE